MIIVKKWVKVLEVHNNNVCCACGGSGSITVELDDDGDMTTQQECAACGGCGYED